MEEEINEGKFIEFGEYKGNLYGTSAETVKSLIGDGFFCILTPHYQVHYKVMGNSSRTSPLTVVYFQALKMLRTPDVKPYIVFIKPPEFDALKETRNAAFARSTFDETNSRGFTVTPDDLANNISQREHDLSILIIFVGRRIPRNNQKLSKD